MRHHSLLLSNVGETLAHNSANQRSPRVYMVLAGAAGSVARASAVPAGVTVRRFPLPWGAADRCERWKAAEILRCPK
jgi:hypothetical protein